MFLCAIVTFALFLAPNGQEGDLAAGLRDRAIGMLRTAESEAHQSSSGMRAFNLLQVARAYGVSDRGKALSLLQHAFAATLAMETTRSESQFAQIRAGGKGQLQEEIALAIYELAPDKVEGLLAQVEPYSRDFVLKTILSGVLKQKQYERAIKLVEESAQPGQFPYEAADRVLGALPIDAQEKREHLFLAALSNFSESPPEKQASLGTDLGDLVVHHWRNLPIGAVRQAIEEIAKSAEHKTAEPYIFGGPGFTASLSSRNEYTLYKVISVLQQIDSFAVKSLLEKHSSIQALQLRYGNDVQTQSRSIAQSRAIKSKDSDGGSGDVVESSRGGGIPERFEFRGADKHPRDAIAVALRVSNPELRARVFRRIAEVNESSDPAAAKVALEKLLEISGIDPEQEARHVCTAIRTYLKLSAMEEALTTVDKGAKVAKKLYDLDNRRSDPNKALKAFWPSSNMWRQMISFAAQISPDTAVRITNEIEDDEIRAAERIILVGTWLGAPSVPFRVLVQDSRRAGEITRF